MDAKKQQEEFNVAFVSAIAAHLGLARASFSVDDDSIDIVFQARGWKARKAVTSRPQIQLQLKCTAAAFKAGSHFSFPLKKKNYDDLRGRDVMVPRYLAILMVPKKVKEWVRHDDAEMALRHRAFWVSLRDAPASGNGTSVSVRVPYAQRLTSDALRKMVDAASRLESL